MGEGSWRFAGRPVAALLALVAAMLLACGPTAQQDQPSNDDLPSAVAQGEPLPTFTPWPTVTPRPFPTNLPTITPLPADFVKPTDSPQPTPWPTLEPDPTVDPHIRELLEAPTPTPPPLADQVTEYTQTEEFRNYEAIARVRVLSQRTVPVPDDILEWPVDEIAYMGTEERGFVPWTRSKVEIIELLHDEAPDYFEILGTELIPNSSLEVDQEYVVFVAAVVVGDDDPRDDGRSRLGKKRLEAFGGEAWFYDNDQTWIIDGDTAWRIPKSHLYGGPAGPHLTAAKASGESLPVAELLAAINRGIKK